MLKVAYITNSGPKSGVGVRALEILKQLRALDDVAVTVFHLDGERGVAFRGGEEIFRVGSMPGILGSKTINWIRLGRRLSRFVDDFDVVHATNQTLSFISTSKPLVVTVHDIIELLEPQSGLSGWAARYLYSGLVGASQLIAVSQYTADTVTQKLGVPVERIALSPNATGTAFAPIPEFTTSLGYQTLRQELRLKPDDQVVLYVGSDHPRKNVVTALSTFAAVQHDIPNTVFVKVGRAGLLAGREETLAEIDRLGIRDAARVLDAVSTQRLNELYNLADVLLYPSLFEGFGLPPLQAMAAGTAVVTSNATSLPEVVGEAARVCAPTDTDCLTKAVAEILGNPQLRSDMAQAGIKQAGGFSWETSANMVRAAYDQVL
ncbi:hypothetical protein CL628_00685 [bacterium]|nr:hypothetical protein [bacterium]